MNQPMGMEECKALSSIVSKGEPEQPAKLHVRVDQDLMETGPEAVLMHYRSDGAILYSTANESTDILMLQLPGTKQEVVEKILIPPCVTHRI